MLNRRKLKCSNNTINFNITTKSLKSKYEKTGKKLPTVISPIGEKYIIENIRSFAREHNLDPSHLGRVIRGKEPKHKGWVLDNGS